MKKRTIEADFYWGAKPEIFQLAKSLRANMTPAEKHLWQFLRMSPFKEWYFRRQHPINQFIVDFYSYKANLVIEIDGSIHEVDSVRERDEGREIILKKFGLQLIRFSNEVVFNNISAVLEEINYYLHVLQDDYETNS